MNGEARFLKRKVKPGHVDIHPFDQAIVVNYEIEAVILSDDGDPMLGECKRCQKTIRVTNLDQKTNIGALASSIIQSCKLINPNKQPEVERLVEFLLERAESQEFLKHAKEAQQTQSLLKRNEPKENAIMGDVSSYIELLYEDEKQMVKGTAMLMQLAQNPDNLNELLINEPLIGALTRILREEAAKNMDLLSNIIQFFLAFSSFTVFHRFLKLHKIGSRCLSIISTELDRYKGWEASLEKKKRKLRAQQAPESEMQALMKRFADHCFKQDTLLYVALHLLLNLAEDTWVQVMMKNKHIVAELMVMLGRDNIEFLMLIVTFLKKLSIFVENKDEMKEADIVAQLAPLLHSPYPQLLDITLGLLLNLSFDEELRRRMVELQLLPRFVELLADPEYSSLTPAILSILYHISIDDENKAHFSTGKSNCLPVCIGMLVDKKRKEAPSFELMALLCNLAANADNAETMSGNGGLKLLIKRAVKTRDPLLMKMVRNISIHPKTELKMLFLDHVERIVQVMLDPDTESDLLVEALGILGNVTIPDFDYAAFMSEFELLDFIGENLLPDAADDDILLQLIILLSTLLADDDCAQLVARCGMVESLVDLIQAKQEDDEIVLHISFCFYKFLFFQSTRDLILKQEHLVPYLIDMMHDKNLEVQRICKGALDIVTQFDDTYTDQIRARKFEFHNAQWLQSIVADPSVGDDQQPSLDQFDHDSDPYGYDHPDESFYDVHDMDDIAAEHGDHLYEPHADDFLEFDARASPL